MPEPTTAAYIGAAGLGAATDVFNVSSARDANNAQNALTAAGYEYSNYMYRHRYQHTVKDMKRAGLNPMLAYMQGTGGGAAQPSSGMPQHAPRIEGKWIASAIDAMRSMAEVRNIDASTDEIRARTPTHAATISKMEQEIKESVERVNQIMANTNLLRQQERTSAASQALFAQQRTNLQEEVAKIRAQVDGIKSTSIKDLAAAGQMSAHENEIRQRIVENLPKIEAALKQLEVSTQKLQMPQREWDAAARDKFLGAWNAVVRALAGQK